MGIGIHIVEPLLREHAYRPISGDVVTIGRQTVYFPPHEILQLMRDHGINIDGVDSASIEIDRNTIDRLPEFERVELITDRALFRLLGVERILAVDRSKYEAADIIHDLALPVPPHLREIADFIVDGSTLDNTFNPAQTLRNYAEMLRPGGRLLALNAFSCWDKPYSIMPPLWYLDYFVMNGFIDCKAYVLVFVDGNTNVFWLDVNWLQEHRRAMGRFVSPHHMCAVIFAEKGPDSTTDRYPVQQDYRSEEDWAVYSKNLAVLQRSTRPHLLRSNADLMIRDVVGGHWLVDHHFRLVSPNKPGPQPAPMHVDGRENLGHNETTHRSNERRGAPMFRRLKRAIVGAVRARGYEIVKASDPRLWGRQLPAATEREKRPIDLDAALGTIRAHAADEATAASIFDRQLRDVVIPHHRSVYWGDRMLTLDKSAGFRDDARFAAAMQTITGSLQYDQYSSPDGVAWRLNTLVWAARCGLSVPGDFVECGVYRGDFAWVITQCVDFERAGRTFWLYDTFAGFAPQYSSPDDFPSAPEFFDFVNNLYHEPRLYESVRERFVAQNAVKVIRGTVPDVLRGSAPERIAFLHIDMNSAGPEVGALEMLFDRVSPGGVIVFDDYGWLLFRRQKEAEDRFMAKRGYEILELPTGQGFVFKR